MNEDIDLCFAGYAVAKAAESIKSLLCFSLEDERIHGIGPQICHSGSASESTKGVSGFGYLRISPAGTGLPK